MLKALFEYYNYKHYLNDYTSSKNRGEKSKISEALRCHIAYVSQVLNGDAHFSLEQADLLNHYLGHSDEESDFFLLFVSHARAGSESLRKRFDDKIKKILKDRLSLENRLKTKKLLPPEHHGIYYGAWYYSAIHLLISIPQFQTRDKIADHLGLPMNQVMKALNFLVETGLASFFQGKYRSGQVGLHLQNDSPWLSRHHSSWRIQSMHKAEEQDSKNFHYTSVVSLSAHDAIEIRKLILESIENIRGIVRNSPEEKVYCYLIDLFPV
jgi:uncharacterized protein (TIGR02147 family)